MTDFVKTKSGKTNIVNTMGTVGNDSIFGHYLRKLREKKGLKLNEVGLELKVDSTLLSKYESGTRFPKKEKLQQIASFFRVDRNELAKMIAKDKQKSHYRRLSSETETKNKESRDKK
ncbi:MAG: helix-turn-helix transcriptional regulator [Bacteroidota bacterium]